ncbi:hypothetical protein CEUSTIGMA_g943.t1 [Chlamydomonas eustigma]|uniref:Peroxisomal membrane protein PEX16 n=1 Tax=Chlamydomonas eustigma TaxID=1157962 RepID=A0A250WRS0_9CHLO|nr:hypothetical protein CEUSTIGMA_g943.t1 [Chlamydomonas eustigma]|eukprot:GAX73491.1 hypothetical protein CEUSTIGMA_g943.t1 [Chlamydomonas eustigma]
MIGISVAAYKTWVKANPGIVQGLEWLLYAFQWNPGRLNSSEVGYETYHAVLGLMSVWHAQILDEDSSDERRSPCSVWLDMLEQVETVIELQAIRLEKSGYANSRYGPLLVLELFKSILKLLVWSHLPSNGRLFLRQPTPEDLDQIESEQGVQDLEAALQRLHVRYTSGPLHSSCKPEEISNVYWCCHSSSLNPDPPLGLDSTFRLLTRVPGLLKDRLQRVWNIMSPAGALMSLMHGCMAGEDNSGSSGSNHLFTEQPLSDPQMKALEEAKHRCTRVLMDEESMQILDSLFSEQVSARIDDKSMVQCSSMQRSQDSRCVSSTASMPVGGNPHKKALASWRAGMIDQAGQIGEDLLWLGDMLHIMRPVIYVLLLLRHGRAAWCPWSGSLSVDALSMFCIQRGKWHLMQSSLQYEQMHMKYGRNKFSDPAAEHSGRGTSASSKLVLDSCIGQQQQATSLLSVALLRSLQNRQWSTGEEREVADRKRKLFLYLLREPCLKLLVKRPVEMLAQGTAGWPFLGAIMEYGSGLLSTLTEYYTYTSGS